MYVFFKDLKIVFYLLFILLNITDRIQEIYKFWKIICLNFQGDNYVNCN